jgi:hypothetical protein
MKKLLFTIAGLFQVLVVFAQRNPVGKTAFTAIPTHYAYRMGANTAINNPVANQKMNNAWLIIDVEGTMPNGRVPGAKGYREAIQERTHREK